MRRIVWRLRTRVPVAAQRVERLKTMSTKGAKRMRMLLTRLEVFIRQDMGLIRDLNAEVVFVFHWKFWEPVLLHFGKKHRFGVYYVVIWEEE